MYAESTDNGKTLAPKAKKRVGRVPAVRENTGRLLLETAGEAAGTALPPPPSPGKAAAAGGRGQVCDKAEGLPRRPRAPAGPRGVRDPWEAPPPPRHRAAGSPAVRALGHAAAPRLR